MTPEELQRQLGIGNQAPTFDAPAFGGLEPLSVNGTPAPTGPLPPLTPAPAPVGPIGPAHLPDPRFPDSSAPSTPYESRVNEYLNAAGPIVPEPVEGNFKDMVRDPTSWLAFSEAVSQPGLSPVQALSAGIRAGAGNYQGGIAKKNEDAAKKAQEQEAARAQKAQLAGQQARNEQDNLTRLEIAELNNANALKRARIGANAAINAGTGGLSDEQKRFEEESSKYAAKRIDEQRKELPTLRGNIRSNQRLVKLLSDPDVDAKFTGPVNQFRGPVAAIINDVAGSDVINPELVNNASVFDALTLRQAVHSRPEGSGQTSNWENGIYIKASPGLNKTYGGNINLLALEAARFEMDAKWLEENNEWLKFQHGADRGREHERFQGYDTFDSYMRDKGSKVFNEQVYENLEKQFAIDLSLPDDKLIGWPVLVPPSDVEDGGVAIEQLTQEAIDLLRFGESEDK